MGRHHVGRRRPWLVPSRPETPFDRQFRYGVAVGTLLLAVFVATQAALAVDGVRAERGGRAGTVTPDGCTVAGGRQSLLFARWRCAGTFVDRELGAAYPVEFFWNASERPRGPLAARVSAGGSAEAWLVGDRAWLRPGALTALLLVPIGIGAVSVVRVARDLFRRSRRRSAAAGAPREQTASGRP
ncbi:hypothetical protein [Catellatospora coxensis]|uniref:hypothetical protein n=1 Tax=Catellatospora coxensis TaxID=310354 RepID=UPI0019438938|nr:hypothetical protein [Catellatospora coxensis]